MFETQTRSYFFLTCPLFWISLLCMQQSPLLDCSLQWGIFGATASRGSSHSEDAVQGNRFWVPTVRVKETMRFFRMKKNLLEDPLGSASLMKSCLMPPMASAQVLKIKVWFFLILVLRNWDLACFFLSRKFGGKRRVCRGLQRNHEW